MSAAPGLGADVVADLVRRARDAAEGPFVDPRWVRSPRCASYPMAWVREVLPAELGEVRPGEDGSHVQRVFLAMAAERDADGVRRHREDAARAALLFMNAQADKAAAERRRELDEWHALRALLPVAVFVGHNWSAGHYELSRTGRDHIVAQEDLAVGRLRRAAGDALCETAARKGERGARGFGPRDHLDRSPVDGERERVPSCAACLRVASRVAEVSPHVEPVMASS